MSDEICRPLLQGGILRPKVFFGKRDFASLVIKLLLQLLQCRLGHGLLILLLLQHYIIGFQLLIELGDDHLLLVQALFLLGQLPLLPGRFPFPFDHLLQVLLEVLTPLLKLGPLRSKLTGHDFDTFLQLGALIAKALVLSLECLPLPEDRHFSLPESLTGVGQHLREGRWRCFWPGAGLEPPPQNDLWLLQNGQRDGIGRTPMGSAITEGISVTAAVGSGVAIGSAAADGLPAGAWGPDGTASAMPAETWGPDDAASGPLAGAWGAEGTVSAVLAGIWGSDGAATTAAGAWGSDDAASTVAVGGRSSASEPADTCCWEPDSPVGATLEAEEEEDLISKGWVNTRQHGS
jgi:hypothetical protein